MSAIETLVIGHLDLWSSAIKRRSTAGRGSSNKIELYGIKKLRELILKLAVRGLLVPQDPNDEPASELLKKIAAEKARLVKEGKIKKAKEPPPIPEKEKPFNLPRTWLWQHLEGVFYPISVSTNKVKTSELLESGSYPVVDQGQSFVAGFINDKDLLISIPGPVIVFGDHTTALKYVDFDFVAGADGVKILRPLCCDERYFYLASKTLPIEKRGYGRHYSRLIDNLVPLPPLAEQHRIVTTVDELMALCDQLESETDTHLSTHQTLVETLLYALTRVSDAAEFKSAWKRLAEHFDSLFTTEESIDQLKQTILQLAVMGKLVPQDQSDEPASELLKKIAVERARLMKDGKIKKEQESPHISEKEKPFDLPRTWLWQRLEGIFYPISASANKVKISELLESGSYPVIDQGQSFIAGFINDKNLLISIPGPVIIFGDHTTVLKYIDFDFVAGADGVKILRPLCCDERYFYLVCKTLPIESRGYGRHYSRLVDNLFPLPPLAEQHRIIAKVGKLMAICNQLKSRLNEAQTTQLQLADAMAKKALART